MNIASCSWWKRLHFSPCTSCACSCTGCAARWALRKVSRPSTCQVHESLQPLSAEKKGTEHKRHKRRKKEGLLRLLCLLCSVPLCLSRRPEGLTGADQLNRNFGRERFHPVRHFNHPL